jgi:O-antigen/teichoic acid export membrane protein
LYFLCNIALTIFFIVLFDFRALGVLLALFLTNLIFAIGTFIVFVPKIKLGINKKYFVDLMKYSLPLIPHSVSGWLITLLDRLFLNNMKSAASVGIYSIGYQFGNIMNVITYSINQAYVPWFFEIVENKDTSKDRLIKASEMIIWGYSFIALTITLFTPEVLSLMVSKGFRDGWVVVPFLCFANVFNGLYYIAANVLWLDKTVLMPIITVTSAFISVFLNYILIPKYGIIGAAISNLAALFIVSIIAIMLAHNVSRIGFNWIKLYLIIFINFALSFIVFLKQYIANPMFIIIKILIILFIMLFLYVKYKIYIKHIVALIYDKCIVYRNIILNKNLS